MNVDVLECKNLDAIIELFNDHRGEPFTYLADTQLFKLFRGLRFCRIFKADINDMTVGSIYAMRYMYKQGWIGGLLVDKRFRRRGIGRKLLEKALEWLGAPYTYAFVEPENIAARKLFEGTGFNAAYRRVDYNVDSTLFNFQGEDKGISHDARREELTEASGFNERRGVVNLGYYPIKLTRNIFEDLKHKQKVLTLGNVIAIIENSYLVNLGAYTFIFNDYILKEASPSTRRIVEVNPFYIRPEIQDMIKLLKSLRCKEAIVHTHHKDIVTSKLPSKRALGALVFELCKDA